MVFEQLYKKKIGLIYNSLKDNKQKWTLRYRKIEILLKETEARLKPGNNLKNNSSSEGKKKALLVKKKKIKINIPGENIKEIYYLKEMFPFVLTQRLRYR